MNFLDDDLDEMLTKIEMFCNAPVYVPPIEKEDFSQYPVLMKSPKSHEKGKNDECKKCLILKKQFEEQISALETQLQTKIHELFDMYSFLNAKIVEIERKHKN
jgi:hypothetical protein